MKAWYSYQRSKYSGDTAYYDLHGKAWYDKLESELPLLREKTLRFLQGDVDVHEYFNSKMVEGSKWESITFLFWGLRNEKVIAQGSGIMEHFRNIPGFISLSVSTLQPRTHIKPHHGDTDAIYRVHIPIYIPAGLPDCGLKVNGIDRPWLDNEMIVFNDACMHEAWNMTDKPRMVLIMDVIREEFLPAQRQICRNVLSSFKYQFFTLKFKFIKKWPGWMKDIVRNYLKYFKKAALH
jgi:beta-hydroxylase